MTQNTQPVRKVIGKKGLAIIPNAARSHSTPSPAGTESTTAVQNHAAPVQPVMAQQPKLSRNTRSERNRLEKQKAQLLELAESKGAKVETVVLRATGDGEQLPAVRGYDSTAKRVTAVAEQGRPSEYTEEEADVICAWVAKGGSLNQYCIQHNRSHVTIYRWLRERAGFQTRYSQAHEDRADTLVDEMVDIADDSQHADSMEAVTAARLRVDTRKWIAMKLKASKYGDKVEVKQTGAINIQIGMKHISQPDPLLVIDAGPDTQLIG